MTRKMRVSRPPRKTAHSKPRMFHTVLHIIMGMNYNHLKQCKIIMKLSYVLYIPKVSCIPISE